MMERRDETRLYDTIVEARFCKESVFFREVMGMGFDGAIIRGLDLHFLIVGHPVVNGST